jgi:hypothetical protein
MTVIVAWIAEAFTTGLYNLSLYPTVNISPVEKARNDIAKHFMESDATHLLFVDSDTIPPVDAIMKLLALDKPIATALTPIVEFNEQTRNYWRKWNCVGMNDVHMQPDTGLQQCKGAGSSCILIRREVFEKMPQPWYEFRYKDDNGKEKEISEDIMFVIKALSMGIETWADTSILCQHYKSVLY